MAKMNDYVPAFRREQSMGLGSWDEMDKDDEREARRNRYPLDNDYNLTEVK